MLPGELYHIGIVVHDLERAQVEMGRAYSLHWGRAREGTREVWQDGRVTEVTFRTCFSVDAPHLELVEEVPGTIWERVAGSAIHHLGFWSDDLRADSLALERAGSALAACGVAPDGSTPTRFAYHRDPRNLYVEIVTSSARTEMAQRWQPVT
jgi:hypothetical protein